MLIVVRQNPELSRGHDMLSANLERCLHERLGVESAFGKINLSEKCWLRKTLDVYGVPEIPLVF